MLTRNSRFSSSSVSNIDAEDYIVLKQSDNPKPGNGIKPSACQYRGVS